MNIFIKIIKFLFKGPTVSAKTKRYINDAISKANSSLKSGDNHLKKASITQLDSMLGLALNDLYGRNSIAENLKKAKNRFNSEIYQKAWNAHKVRNMIVHEPDRYFSDRDLDRAVSDFKIILNKLVG